MTPPGPDARAPPCGYPPPHWRPPPGDPLTSFTLAAGAHRGPASRSARRVRCAAHGPGWGARSRGRGPGSVRAASPSPPSPPRPPRGALARAGTRALRAGTRTHGAHPTRGSAGAAGAAEARARLGLGLGRPDGGRGAGSATARPRVTGPGRRAGPPAGMRSCRAKKAPDVTCSQSACGARGQVTSAGAQLWVQMRGGGRGAGLAATALRPLPSPRTRALALKGAARDPCARLGPHLSQLHLSASRGDPPPHRTQTRGGSGRPGSPRGSSPRRSGLSWRRPPAPRPPQPLFAWGCRRESLRQRPGPRGRPARAPPAASALTRLRDSRGWERASPLGWGGAWELGGRMGRLGHTSRGLWCVGGTVPRRPPSPAPPKTSSP